MGERIYLVDGEAVCPVDREAIYLVITEVICLVDRDTRIPDPDDTIPDSRR